MMTHGSWDSTKAIKSLQDPHRSIIRLHLLPTTHRHANLLLVLRKFTVPPGLLHTLVVPWVASH